MIFCIPLVSLRLPAYWLIAKAANGIYRGGAEDAEKILKWTGTRYESLAYNKNII